MNVWYNEWDKFKAQWLRELGAGGEIPQGTVDERSILDIRGADLAGYGACHFFAGIGGWPLALRLAGCGDDWKGWTASLPCQPFSSAGKRKGFADERHLWPPFFKLVDERRPGKILGEQVDSKDGRAWLARVQADLESIGYAVGRASLNSAGAGAPNIRQRLYWVAHASGSGLPGHDGGGAGQQPQNGRPPYRDGQQQPSPMSGGPGTGSRDGARRANTTTGKPSTTQSGWSTPTARDWKGPDARKRGGISLPRQAVLYRDGRPQSPAITTKAAGGANVPRHPSSAKPDELVGWPTPTAVDRVRDEETMAKCAAFRKKNARQNTVPLYLGEAARMASGPTASPSPSKTAPPEELDAAFGRWLQGYPAAWDRLSPKYDAWQKMQERIAQGESSGMETPSTPSSPQSSSEPQKKPRRIWP